MLPKTVSVVRYGQVEKSSIKYNFDFLIKVLKRDRRQDFQIETLTFKL